MCSVCFPSFPPLSITSFSGIFKPDAEKTSYYAEYKSTGPGANVGTRVKWSHQLTDKEVIEYSLEKIFGDWKVGK